MADRLTNEPELEEIIQEAIDARLLEVRISVPAHVVKVDYEKNTVDVRLMIKGQVDAADGGKTDEDFPVIPNVRIGFIRSGGFRMTFPVSIGDPVRLMNADDYTGTYRATGAPGPAGYRGRFDLSSAFAFPVDERDSSVVDWSSSEAVIDGPGNIRLGGPSAKALGVAEAIEAEFASVATTLGSLTGSASFATLYVPGGGLGTTKVKGE